VPGHHLASLHNTKTKPFKGVKILFSAFCCRNCGRCQTEHGDPKEIFRKKKFFGESERVSGSWVFEIIKSESQRKHLERWVKSCLVITLHLCTIPKLNPLKVWRYYFQHSAAETAADVGFFIICKCYRTLNC